MNAWCLPGVCLVVVGYMPEACLVPLARGLTPRLMDETNGPA